MPRKAQRQDVAKRSRARRCTFPKGKRTKNSEKRKPGVGLCPSPGPMADAGRPCVTDFSHQGRVLSPVRKAKDCLHGALSKMAPRPSSARAQCPAAARQRQISHAGVNRRVFLRNDTTVALGQHCCCPLTAATRANVKKRFFLALNTAFILFFCINFHFISVDVEFEPLLESASFTTVLRKNPSPADPRLRWSASFRCAARTARTCMATQSRRARLAHNRVSPGRPRWRRASPGLLVWCEQKEDKL